MQSTSTIHMALLIVFEPGFHLYWRERQGRVLLPDFLKSQGWSGIRPYYPDNRPGTPQLHQTLFTFEESNNRRNKSSLRLTDLN